MKNILTSTTAILTIALICAPFFASAAAAAAPVDGGLSLLVAAGVSYGAKKIAKNRKKAK